MTLVHQFSYRAVSPAGGAVVKGTIEAATEGAVTSKLHAQGLMPLEISEVSKTGLRRDVVIPGFERRVKVKALALFAKQLAGLLNAGLPLMRSLAILIEQTEDRTLQTAIVSVQADVEAGLAFSAGLAKQPKVFPPLMVSIVRVGESGGFLGESLTSIAETYSREVDLQNKIRAATTYPIVVLIIAVLGMLAMVTFVVPIFEGMFAGIGSELPLPTQILVTLSHNMFWILPLLFVVCAGAWVWWSQSKENPGYRRVVDPIKLKMPIFGQLATKIAVARFARNLSMMLNAGVPLIQALSIVGEASHNWAIERAVHDIQESVRQGRSFSAPLAKAEVFPPMVAQMVSVGEESGTLAEMLASVADFYENEVETATAQLTATIEPLLIVAVGVLIGGMVVSLYLPIFTLYGELSQG